MATMYETIMSLPLFKGISKELVSAFLEKTHVQFVNYSDGEKIVSVGDVCTHVKYVITGSVRVTVTNSFNNLKIIEKRPSGVSLAPEYLFGMDTRYPFDVEACGNVSVMQFSKEQYLNLLHTDSIYMLNCLNYLSFHSQRPVNAVRMLGDGSLESELGLWIMAMTDTSGTEIEIRCSRSDLKKITRLDEASLEASLARMKRNNLITFNNLGIKILSRRRLLDYINDRLLPQEDM